MIEFYKIMRCFENVCFARTTYILLRDNLVQSGNLMPQGSPERSTAYNTREGDLPASSTFNVPTAPAHSRPQRLLLEGVVAFLWLADVGCDNKVTRRFAENQATRLSSQALI